MRRPRKGGQISFNISNSPMVAENDLESMENPMNWIDEEPI